MNKRIAILMLSVMCAICTSCQSQQQSESDPISEKSVTEQTTTAPDSSTTSISEDGFTVHRVELPDAVDTSLTSVMIEGFDYQEIVQNLFGETLEVVAIDYDDIVIQKRIAISDSNNSIFEYYKYNIKNNVLLRLDGNVPNACFSVGNYALVDGKIESVCESGSFERIYYTADLQNNRVTIQKTESANPDTESFYYNYSWDEASYIQLWYEIGTESMRYANISKCSPDGKTAIFTHRKADSYAFSDQKIYELTTDEQKNMKCVNILNEDGSLESTIYLPEVEDALQSIEAEYRAITDFKVIGNSILINVRDEYQCAEMCFLYNIKQNRLSLLPECRSLQPAQATNSDIGTLYFYSIPNSLEDTINLYCVDGTGNISLLAENLSSRSSFATDGQNVVYFNNHQLYLANTG